MIFILFIFYLNSQPRNGHTNLSFVNDTTIGKTIGSTHTSRARLSSQLAVIERVKAMKETCVVVFCIA